MSDTTVARKFHLSINVADLSKSVAFYRVLFGQAPAKHHADYAKFELSSPPAVISLIPGKSGGGGALNHVGLCLLDSEELVAIQKRLEEAGFSTLREDGVACCYSRQTKFWVRDPDRVLIELYVFHEDLDEHGDGHAPEDADTLAGESSETESPAATWTHQLGDSLAFPLPQSSNSLQEITLEGSLNASQGALPLSLLLAETYRLLKPGGKVTLHGLAADRPLANPSPILPGPAAAVRHVPHTTSLVNQLREARFHQAKFLKLSENGYFEFEGIPLREVLIEATKPGFRSATNDQDLVYLGPLAAVEDDFGNRFEKGIPTPVNMHDWLALKNSCEGAFSRRQRKATTPDTATTCTDDCPDSKVPMSSKARYIMIGGFLGAGKTTTVGRLAKYLTDQGLSVGLITNDQAGGLVDTKLLRGQGYATEEIAGGCFCCRFNTLVDAANKLSDLAKPDVFIAEPVGSCTDLVATVTYPLRRMYGDAFTIAPLSVLVDPVRARRVFGLDAGGTFSSKVAYIFKKQLEEADIIVISKSEIIGDAQREELRATLEREFPNAKVQEASPRLGTGLDDLFSQLMTDEQSRRSPMAVDYEVYADGEALLGWLNATVTLKATEEFDANDFLRKLATDVQGRLQKDGSEIAHFKMTYSPDDGIGGELASINLVRSDYVAELGMELDEPSEGGQLIVNLRAEADPTTLVNAVQAGLAEVSQQYPTLTTTLDHEEHFRPGKPTPTHRDGEVVMEVKGGCKPGSGCC